MLDTQRKRRFAATAKATGPFAGDNSAPYLSTDLIDRSNRLDRNRSLPPCLSVGCKGEATIASEAEGQMRAIAVLNLEVEGETPAARAAEIGRMFQRIAGDQMERPRTFRERDAIAHFRA
jgi:hypothetical protein